jgi:aspartyl/asparaginyl beta-hydroxylase (cupin superfamily)
MNASPDAPSLASAGFEALRRGDASAARDLFKRAVAAGAPADTWFGLALAHRRLGAADEEGSALERALAQDPNHLPALIAKADLYMRKGDERAASAYYATAIRAASALPSLPAEWRAEVQRVEGAREALMRKFQADLLAALAERGLGEPGTQRVAHAVELLLGRREVFLQQPKYFYFPELPQVQFYDRREFPWAHKLEQRTPEIVAELRAILATHQGFVPYIQRAADRPIVNPNPLMDSLDWGACYLIKDGAEVRENAERCPRTLQALSEVPLCRIPGRTPSVLFSMLKAGTRIRPHNGFTNVRLICHLPLIVPPDCGFRVGNETRPWREGELTIFDDSIEHEAWNSSDAIRVVLLFDIWRPELSSREQALIAAILEAAKGSVAERQVWTD